MSKYDVERRKILVSKSFQLRFVWFMLIPIFIYAIIVLLTAIFTMWPLAQEDIQRQMDYSSELSSALLETYQIATTDTSGIAARKDRIDQEVSLKELLKRTNRVEVDKYLINSLIMMGTNLVIALLIVTILAIRISHRLMGPVPRLKRNLKAIINGDLTKKIIFRDRDELKPILEDDFNGMLDSFSEKIRKMTANAQEMNDLIQNEDEISGEKMMKLQKELKEIRSVLNGFQYNK